MTTFEIQQPLYLDGPRRGDLIVLPLDGDDPDTTLDKLLASYTTIPPYLPAQERELVERGWPKGRIVPPTRWVVGMVARVRTGRVVGMTALDGQRHDVPRGWYHTYAHREQMDDPEVASAFAAAAPSFAAAVDVLHQHATRSPRPDPNMGQPVLTRVTIDR